MDIVSQSWSASETERQDNSHANKPTSTNNLWGSKTNSKRKGSVDVSKLTPELEGLRNSEHRLSRILINLGSPLASTNSRRGRAKKIHRKSIIDIKNNERILQVEWKRRYWDLFLCFFVFLYNIITPYRISFFDKNHRGSSDFFFAFERITELLYIADIVGFYWDVFILLARKLPFLDPIIDNSGHKMKAINIDEKIPYSSLVIDVVSILPLEPIVIALAGSNHKVRAFAKCLPFFRMLRTFTVIMYQKRYEKHLLHINVINVETVQLLANTLLLVILVHSSACLWWLTYALEGYPEDGWDNFVVKFDLNYRPPWEKYTAALYWSTQTMTTIGFGDVTPNSIPELAVSIMVMIIGAVTFAYFVGKMSANVQDANKASSRFHQCMRELNEFMVQRQLPPSMQTKIRAFFQYRHLSGKWGFDESALLREMSPTMRAAVILYNNKDAIRRVPWFADGEPDFLFRICACLHTIYCAPGELLIREGELGQEMYLLIKGQVEIFNQTRTFHTVMEARDASEAKYFGEVSALFGDRRMASVKAMTFLDVLAITKSDLDDVLTFFPALRARIRREGFRRRKRRVYIKIIAVVRLMNLCKTDRRVTTDWTVEDLLNLKANLSKPTQGTVIDPTLTDLDHITMNINEITSVTNLSSAGGKSRRSSIASINDIADKEFLDELVSEVEKAKQSEKGVSSKYKKSSYSGSPKSARARAQSRSVEDYIRDQRKGSSFDVQLGTQLSNLGMKTGRHRVSDPTDPTRNNLSLASMVVESGSPGPSTPRKQSAISSTSLAADSGDRDKLLLGNVQLMLQTFKDDLVSSLDQRYTLKGGGASEPVSRKTSLVKKAAQQQQQQQQQLMSRTASSIDLDEWAEEKDKERDKRKVKD